MNTKVIIFSAPSGSGKSTLIHYLMGCELGLHFSVSATSREPRGAERDGVDYYFLSPEEFRRRIAQGDFLEYEEVYEGRFYGTLREQVDRQLAAGQHVVCDVDVKGAAGIKRHYGERSLSVFIQPPSVEVLRQRLVGRGTESEEAIAARLARAEFELSLAPQFDAVVVNDDLDAAQREVETIVRRFLSL